MSLRLFFANARELSKPFRLLDKERPTFWQVGSPLHPSKADMLSVPIDVVQVPKADIEPHIAVKEALSDGKVQGY